MVYHSVKPENKFMHTQIFRRAVSIVIVCAAIASAFSVSVFGQNEITDGCANEDFNCWISRASQQIQAHPKDAKAYKVRGYAYMTLELYAEAIRDFKRLKELDAADSYADECLKYIYAKIKASELSFEQYDVLISLEPTNADFHYYRSRLSLKVKNYEKAVEDSTKAIELDAKYADAYAVRADSYCKLRKSKESNADIARYEYLTGKDTKAFCKICEQEPIDCAINNLTEQIALAMKYKVLSKLDYLYFQRGNLYYGKKDYDSALVDYNKIRNLSNFKDVWIYRGEIYLRKSKYDEALADFIRYLLGNPASNEINFRVAEIYFMKRDYEAAFEYYDRVIVLSPGNTKAYFARGTIYLEFAENLGKTGTGEITTAEMYRKAVNDFDYVIEKYSKDTDPKVFLKRAEAYERLGEREKAEADRKKYLELTEKP